MSLHFCMDPFHQVYIHLQKKKKRKEKVANVCMKYKLVITTIIKKSTTSLIVTVTVWVCIIVCRIMCGEGKSSVIWLL